MHSVSSSDQPPAFQTFQLGRLTTVLCKAIKNLLRVFFVLNPLVLVLAGVVLIFFIVAGMGICFGLVLETVLIIQGCFSYC